MKSLKNFGQKNLKIKTISLFSKTDMKTLDYAYLPYSVVAKKLSPVLAQVPHLVTVTEKSKL
jgi:hypothetical protein